MWAAQDALGSLCEPDYPGLARSEVRLLARHAFRDSRAPAGVVSVAFGRRFRFHPCVEIRSLKVLMLGNALMGANTTQK